MRFLTIVTLFLLLCNYSFAQEEESWSIFHNDRKILSGSGPFDKKKHTVNIIRRSLDSSGSLIAEYFETNTRINSQLWIRVMEVADKKQYIRYYQDSTSRLEISNKALKNLFERRKTLWIYTWVHPSKESGFRAKVHIVHLCTLRLR